MKQPWNHAEKWALPEKGASRLPGGWLVLAVLIFSQASLRAIPITAVFTDLPDIHAGQDLWEVSYSVSGGTFSQYEGFSVFFDPALFDSQSLSLVHSPASGWSTLIVPYQSFPPGDAYLDAQAQVSAPAVSDTFDVTFVWLGGVGTSPGPQQTELYQIDPNTGTFTGLGFGETVVGNSVPESAAGLSGFFFAVLAAMLGAARRMRPVAG